MKNRIISLVLVFCMILCYTTTVSYAQDEYSQDIEAIKDTVSYFNIMNGDPDGNFRLSDNITRAEFSKVGVAASKYKDYVAPNAYISPFKDVKYTHWAAPYVKVALDNGIMAGYEDGTFRPDKNVTIEEVITVYMRLLGYTDEEFGVSWPYGQISAAKDIGLCDNVDVTVGAAATRKDVLVLSYNLLGTDTKGSNTDYISVHNHGMVEDVILLDAKSTDAYTKSNEIVTTSGTYKVADNFDLSNVGLIGDICVDTKNNRIVSFVPDDGVIEKHIVYKALTSEVVTYKDGIITNVNMTDVPKIYDETSASSVNGVMSKMKIGDVLYVKYNSNSSVDYMIYKSGVLEGPITIKSNDWANELSIDANVATITKNGDKVSKESIAVDDIIYYSPELAVIMAYSKKVTGIYEKATPNRDMPTSVTISGVTYVLEGINAFNALSSIGDIKYGDKITAFMGKDGSIADAKKVGDGAENFNYIISITDDIEGPVTADNDNWYASIGIDKNNITVVRNGVKVTFDKIQPNDIVYYSDDYDALFVYSNKITGIYEKAVPNKDMPTSVVVSGVEYKLEDITAFNALSSGGSLKYGDTIMLLMGRNNMIADAKKISDGGDNINYMISKTDDLEGPITVKDTQWYTTRGIDIANVTVIRNGEKKSFDDIQPNDIVYYSDDYDALFVYSNKITGIYEKAIPNRDMPSSVVVSGTEYKLEDVTAFNALSSGGSLKYGDTIMLFMGKDNMIADAKKISDGGDNINYMISKTDDLEGPITVKGTQWYTSRGIDKDSVIVIRDGEKKSFNDIQTYDIAYYADDYDALLVYSNKITGIYEKATPNKDMPTSVVVSGVEYKLEDITAFNALSSGGDLKYGDTITLLMGKDGLIADAVGANSVTENVSLVGYLMATGQKTYQDVNNNDYTSYYVSVLLADGSVSEYRTQKDYKKDVGEICSVTFDGSYAKVKAGITGADVYGKVDSKNRKIGRYNIADDINIIDLSAYQTGLNEPMKYKKVFLQRLDAATLTSRDVIYASYDDNDCIDTLILNNFTGDALEYGIVTKVNKDSNSGSISYNCMIDGKTFSASGKGINVPSAAAGAKIVMNSNDSGIYRISSLYSLSSQNVSGVTLSNVVGSDGVIYTYADDVQVYKMTPGSDGVYYTYGRIPLDNLLNLSDNDNVTVYYDKKDSQGGRVRVIVVKTN